MIYFPFQLYSIIQFGRKTILCLAEFNFTVTSNILFIFYDCHFYTSIEFSVSVKFCFEYKNISNPRVTQHPRHYNLHIVVYYISRRRQAVPSPDTSNRASSIPTPYFVNFVPQRTQETNERRAEEKGNVRLIYFNQSDGMASICILMCKYTKADPLTRGEFMLYVCISNFEKRNFNSIMLRMWYRSQRKRIYVYLQRYTYKTVYTGSHDARALFFCFFSNSGDRKNKRIRRGLSYRSRVLYPRLYSINVKYFSVYISFFLFSSKEDILSYLHLYKTLAYEKTTSHYKITGNSRS